MRTRLACNEIACEGDRTFNSSLDHLNHFGALEARQEGSPGREPGVRASQSQESRQGRKNICRPGRGFAIRRTKPRAHDRYVFSGVGTATLSAPSINSDICHASFQSARGLAQSKTLRAGLALMQTRQRLGLRRPSAAFQQREMAWMDGYTTTLNRNHAQGLSSDQPFGPPIPDEGKATSIPVAANIRTGHA